MINLVPPNMKNTARTLRALWRHRSHVAVIMRRSLFTSFRYDGMSKAQTVALDVRFVLTCAKHAAA